MTQTLQPDDLFARVKFDTNGLVPAVAQDAQTGAVLMVAWMNEQALRLTMASRKVTYWSRSRRELWRKGETSGHIQHLQELWIDCDGDTILLKVSQSGPACHTGAATCFFQKAEI